MPIDDGKSKDELAAMTPEQRFAHQRKIDVGNVSAKVLDEEQRRAAVRAAKLKKMTQDIEKILLDNNATWSDWHHVVEQFNVRNAAVIPNLPLSFIKAEFEKPQTL